MTLITPKMFKDDNPMLSFRKRVHLFDKALIKEACKITPSQIQAAKLLKLDRTSLRRIIG